MSVAAMYKGASAETRQLVDALLEQDATDRAWAEQVGPSLSQADAARLLGKSEQATAKDPRLLRVKTRSGRIAYPVVQFDGRRPLDGIAEVIELLDPVADALTVLAWLTGSHRGLGGRRPVDALRDGDVGAVLTVAGRFASDAA
jgi:hypothetical protein